MPIDDIGYLKKHSQVDSATFFVDSSLRDQNLWPSPAEFSVHFEEPYRMVIGVEVLDASIPATMYNIDRDGDTLIYAILARPPETNMQFQTLVTQLQNVPLFANWYMKLMEPNIMITCNSAAWTTVSSNDPTVPLRLTMENTRTLQPMPIGQRRAIVIVRHDVLNLNLLDNSLNQYTNDPEFSTVKTLRGTSVAFRNSTTDPEVVLAAAEQRLVIGNDVTYYQFYVTDNEDINELRDLLLYDLQVTTYVGKIERANYDINTLLLHMGIVVGTNGISVTSTTSANVEMAAKYRFTCPNEFFFDMQRSTCGKALGYDLLARSDTNEDGFYQKIILPGNDRLFMSKQQVGGSVGQHVLISPGVIDVAGVRYLLLRCPEIEQHRPVAVRTADPGLGMFKLAGISDLTHLRFDFVSLIKKPIHPIGKVTRMTFRFETAQGKLYDFKGVNLQMLMMVKFLVPTPEWKKEKYILNPEYMPNYLDYMIRDMNRSLLEYDTDETDESEDSEETSEEEDAAAT